jgi:crotonobetainyl-CoA:carnitine CoA-transferase CaiB-like acyl-CoA transferase
VANEYVVNNPSKPGQLLVPGPVQFDQRPPRIASGAPRQGEHSEQILRETGYSDDVIRELQIGGVIVQGATDGWDEFGRLST